MAQLSTQEVMLMPESELVAVLKVMSLDNLEQHARGLMKELGSNHYAKLMSLLLSGLQKERQKNNMSNTERFSFVQNTIRDFLPNKALMSDVYERLATIIMLIIAQKYRAILDTK
jgi:hypothetical protein